MLNIIDSIFFVIERLTSRKVEYQMAVLINSLANLNIRIVNNERTVWTSYLEYNIRKYCVTYFKFND